MVQLSIQTILNSIDDVFVELIPFTCYYTFSSIKRSSTMYYLSRKAYAHLVILYIV